MKHMKYIIIFNLTFLISTISSVVVNAAPSTPSITGTVTHGGVVTVTGTGFGVKSPVAPLLWDSVDGKYPGITNGGIVPTGGSNVWGLSMLDVPVHFKTTNPRGKFTAKYTNTGSTDSAKKAALGGRNYPGSKVLYVNWWMWLDKTACTASSSNKYTRFTDDGDWTSNVQTVIWEPNSVIIFGAGGPNYNAWPQACGKTGVWQRMEKTVDNTTTPIHPSVWLAVDNSPIGSQPISAPSSLLKDITGIYGIGFDGSNTPASEQPTIDWGEIYVDNTRARVEICNASTKASSNHCEIQIPQTTWVDNKLEIKVNQGSFPDNSSAYLYVVDASGTASPGKQITFGSSGGGTSDTTPPTGTTLPTNVADSTAPTVSITSPTSNATITGSKAITATATDNVGVAKVEFYLDSASATAIAADTASPYTFTWNSSTVANGSHTLYAKATDAANNSTISTGIKVTVSNTVVDSTAPAVSITSPTSNATITGSTTVTATATDNVGVAQVDFFVDSTSSNAVATDTTSPYSFTWNPATVANGVHTLYARASDAAGNTKLSNVAVTVSVPVSSSSSVNVSRSECANAPSGTVFCEDFESATPKSHFDDYDGNPDTENLVVTDKGPAVDPANRAIRLRVPAGERGGADLIKVLPNSYDKLYARWYFKYEPGFNFNAENHGGGLSAGDRSLIGQSGNRPTGADFAGFYQQYQANSAKPFSYSYNRGMYQDCSDPNGNCWGDSLPCVYDNGEYYCKKAQDRPTVTLPTLVSGQWYCYEQMVDMGAPSTTGSGATGRVTQWIDGSQIGDNTNLWLRTTADLKLQNLWLQLFHHDGTHSTVGELIDNVVVSTNRIGCGSAGFSVPVPPTPDLSIIKVTP
ncbi:hypothetical protein FCL47_19945 [Desulfopila sp. IMCC35006]|uniref:Ig-like domain-containing protein n=1 Tax=Desulfopila sp. IMCC35006 TaxID=2569542 RepID=UPI0010AB6239|nr:Ig-like domain-containing protein [Desulfopila sp. IMCC35006]TKB23944.1 hypothetical protein FCL47_19945 [Desulfopila sp. IMCC35006]